MSPFKTIAAATAGAALLSACASGPAPAPAPAPQRPAPVRPAPPPATPDAPRAEASQHDAPDPPLTPGDWSYSEERAGSVAGYGPAGAERFSLRCDPSRREIHFSVGGAQPALRVRTSYGERSVAAGSRLAAADPLLDEIAYSRGRFTVEGQGLAPLILPTWPEPARVVEDCRG